MQQYTLRIGKDHLHAKLLLNAHFPFLKFFYPHNLKLQLFHKNPCPETGLMYFLWPYIQDYLVYMPGLKNNINSFIAGTDDDYKDIITKIEDKPDILIKMSENAIPLIIDKCASIMKVNQIFIIFKAIIHIL